MSSLRRLTWVTRAVVLLLPSVFLGCNGQPAKRKPEDGVPAKVQSPGKGIDSTTIASYEKIGAAYGGSEIIEGTYERVARGPEAAKRHIPTFAFNGNPSGNLPKISVPFGLNFAGVKISEKTLRELA